MLLPTGLVMMYVAGTPAKYLLRLAAVVGVAGSLLLANILFAPPGWRIKMQDYQRQRLLVYFGANFASPNASPKEKAEARRLQLEKSYQVRQALISVGSGGLTGKGWCEGVERALRAAQLAREPFDGDGTESVLQEDGLELVEHLLFARHRHRIRQ